MTALLSLLSFSRLPALARGRYDSAPARIYRDGAEVVLAAHGLPEPVQSMVVGPAVSEQAAVGCLSTYLDGAA